MWSKYVGSTKAILFGLYKVSNVSNQIWSKEVGFTNSILFWLSEANNLSNLIQCIQGNSYWFERGEQPRQYCCTRKALSAEMRKCIQGNLFWREENGEKDTETQNNPITVVAASSVLEEDMINIATFLGWKWLK